ncbi:general odorant-binding protein 19a-like isoform X2 [Ceratitis capitata]|nr:general odorant-binding protein 19a-like isoform X2 [Ceratitis capitata]
MWATAKLMRDVCLPRFPKIATELADQLRDGNIPDNNKDVKCYINCVLEMMQTMKKGKFLYEASLKQVDLILPDSYKDDYRAGLLKCKDASAHIKKDNCESAYTVLKCLRGEIKKFIFP